MSEGSEPISTQAVAGTEARQAPAEPAAPTPVTAPPIVAPSVSPTKPQSVSRHSGAWWTIPLLCAGIGLISSAMVIGQIEDNRRLAWQRAKLQQDLGYFQKQIDTNQEFLTKLSSDSNLAERLAQRQTKMVRKGAAILDVGPADTQDDTSPFQLTNVPPPPPVKPYAPSRGVMTILFSHPRIRLYAYGVGAFLIALSLITGASELPQKMKGGR